MKRSIDRYSRTRVLCFSSICVALVAFVSLSSAWQSTSAKKASRFVTDGFVADPPALSKGAINQIAGSTITVNSTSDVANGTDGLCTLREAIIAANSNTSSGAAAGECLAGSNSDADTIDLTGLTGTITLTSELPNISSHMLINGPGSSVLTVLRNSANFDCITIVSSATVAISGLKFQGGAPATNTGITNVGTLNLADCQVSGFGEGVRNVERTLTIFNCVISGNTGGGGISNSSGTINVINSLLTGNASNGSFGPGIDNSFGTLNVTNSTITGNSGHIAIMNGSSARATFINSTVSNNIDGGLLNNGNLSMTGGLITGNTNGGLIANGTTALINGVTISNNSSNGGAFIGGGGISAGGSAVTVMNCVVTNNSTSGNGGGIRNSGGKLTLINTTISGNTSNGSGGGLASVDGGLADFNAINMTITGNRSNNGGGVFRESGSMKFKNSLIAGNFDLIGTTPNDISGTLDPLSSFNLIGIGGSGGLTNGVNNNLVGVADARLAPLANNGGPTLTHALLANSPALDAGDNCVTQASHCGEPKFPQLTTDQRGFNRLVDGPDADTTVTVDIGAYETQLTLANLPDTSTNEDTQLVVPFDAGDTSTITSVTASSSNPALVPNDPAHLSVVLAGTNGVVTINPVANLSGTTNITVTVNRTGGGIESKTFVLTVNPVNEVPAFTKGADQTVNEDAGAQTVANWATSLSAGPPDESGQTLSFQVTNNTNAGLFASGPAIDSAGTLTYTPAPNASGSAAITIVLKDNGGTANGGVDTSAPQTFIITINPVNDVPSFSKGPDQTVNEDSGPQFISGWATSISAGPNDSGQILTFQVTNNSNPSLFSVAPSINSSGGLSFTPAANANGSATITIVLQDNGGTGNGGVDMSAPQSFTITVNPVNDAPSFTKGANQFVNNDAGAKTITSWATNITAGPAGDSGQTLNFQVISNTNASLFTVVPSVSPTGTLTFQPAPNADGTATITISLKDDGGTANGGNDTSASQSFTITVLPAGVPPPLTLVVNTVGDAADTNVGDGICDTDAGTAGEQCTLRAAIQETNSAPTDDTINFSFTLPATSIITLNSVLPDIAGNLAINGPSANLLTVQRNTAGGTPDFRIFTINSGTTVAMTGMTIANGRVGITGAGIRNNGALTLTGCYLFGNHAEQAGGAIFNSGTSLTLNDCKIGGTSPGQPNSATGGGGGINNGAGTLSISGGSIVGNSDGGVFVAGGTASIDGVVITNNSAAGGGGGVTAVNATANIVNCLIANNTAASGAGVFNQGGSTGVVNSTISGNVASGAGGGVRNQSGTLTLTNVTISNNRSNGGPGGGMSVNGTVNLRNTIVAGNFLGPSPSTSASDISGSVSFSSFNNLIGTGGSGGLNNFSNGNQVGVAFFNVRLGPLADNGGPTQTHALLPGSTALDAGSNSFVTNPPFPGSAPFTDQRGAGFKRILDAADSNTTQTVDIGAYEAHPMIEDLGNRITNEDVSITCLVYNVGDETEGLLSIVATSSNQSLVVDLNLNPNLPNAAGSRCLAIGLEPNQFGSTTITLTLTGNNGRTISDSFLLTVDPVGDAPSVTPATTNEDTQSTSGLVITPNPADGAEVIAFRITNIQNGTLFRSNGGGQVFSNSIITFAEGSAGLKFTPAPDLNSSSSSFGFTVQALTNFGFGSAGPGTNASITVNPVNDAPVFTKGPDVNVNQQAGGYSISNWATNISAGAANESAQTLTFQVLSNSNSALFSVQPAIDSSGTLTFTGVPNTTGTATLTINLKDDGGTALGGQDTSVPQTFNITITPPAISLVVNTLGDAADSNVGDSTCDTDPAPGDQCTLRAAIQETNASSAANGNTISFTLAAPAVITLNSALPDINTNLIVTGPGANSLTVQRNSAGGTPNFRIFTINSGKTVQISDLTIANGNVVAGNLPENSGGGILNAGTLTLTNSVVSGNTAARFGGGILVFLGTLTVSNSVILGNNAESGGGVASIGGTTNIDQSTIKNNLATSSGAGLANLTGSQLSSMTVSGSTISNNTSQGTGGGIYNVSTALVTNSTISTNSAGSGGGITSLNPTTLTSVTISGNTASGQGGGMYNPGVGTLTFGNTIIAGNTSPLGPDGQGGNFISQDYNLVGNTSAAGIMGITTHNITNVNALLGPLANNGGPTFTHALLSGSPALDAGNNCVLTNSCTTALPSALTTDQRGAGFSRSADGNGDGTAIVDIGAFEAQVNAVADTPSVTNATTNANTQTTSGLVISRNSADGEEVTHFKITGITGGSLFKNNGTTPISNGNFITFAEGNAGLKFTPGTTNGSFMVQASLSASDAGLGGGTATATITVNPLGGVLRFSTDNYNVAEGAGSATITVERSGDISRAATVDYASSDHSNPADFIPCTSPGAGLASSRCDFTTAIGTLRFAAGETTKTFNVLISQDNYVEGPETLELTLSNPTGGAVFGVPQTATLSIIDDATEPATNPIDTSSEFVRSQYHDILNREPDAPGLAFWTDNIEKCNDPDRRPPGQTVAQCIDKQRESTAVAFFMSPEFQITGGFVYHLYKGSLTGSPNYDGGSAGRFPTSLEFMRDVATVSEGIVVNNAISGAVVEENRNRLAEEFVLRPEFVAKYGGLNNTLYVQELFNTTGIAATTAEKQALVDGLTGGSETRASVLRKVVDGTVVVSEGNVQFTTTYGQAFINQENSRVFVFMEYVGYLRRNPDQAGYVFWLGKLNTFGGDPFAAEMVRSFILAPEYRQRFGQ
jgi:CSLREA domain-containing protein